MGDAAADDRNLRNTAFFPGLIDDVRVHRRALSQRELLECYSQGAADKGLPPFDTTRLGKLVLEPFFYPDEQQVVVSVNSRWLLPLPEHGEVVLELARDAAAEALQTRSVNVNAAGHEDEATFTLKDLPPGPYEIRGFVRATRGVIQAESFTRSSPGVVVANEGWLAGKLDLKGGWAEYDLETTAGDYRLGVLAGRIYDSAGIRCTMDGKDPVDVNLNGSEGGIPAVWERTRWERFGRASLTQGRHTLRLEAIPVSGQDGKSHAVCTYIDAVAVEPIAQEAAAETAVQRVSFALPLAPAAALPSPRRESVGALPPAAKPPAYKAVLTPGGGLEVTVQGRRFRVESTYSYPDGGFNRLAAGALDRQGEAGWQVTAPRNSRRGVLCPRLRRLVCDRAPGGTAADAHPDPRHPPQHEPRGSAASCSATT